MSRTLMYNREYESEDYEFRINVCTTDYKVYELIKEYAEKTITHYEGETARKGMNECKKL